MNSGGTLEKRPLEADDIKAKTLRAEIDYYLQVKGSPSPLFTLMFRVLQSS